MATAFVSVNNTPITINPTTGVTGAVVSAGSTVTIQLLNSSGVNSWNCFPAMVDGYNTNSTVAGIAATIINNVPDNSLTFTAPNMSNDGKYGTAMQWVSIVNPGPQQVKITFGIFVLNSNGSRLFFDGETLESNAISGVAYDLNTLTVATGGGGSGFTAGGDLAGTSTSQTVIKLTGSSGTIPIASTGNVFTWNSATTSPGFAQISTSGATGANMLLSPQASSNANGTPGSVVVNLAAPTGTGSQSNLLIQENGNVGILLGAYPGSAFWQICFGANARTPTGTNFAFLGDDAGTITELNATTLIKIRIGSGGADPIQVNANGVTYFQASGTPDTGSGVGVIAIADAASGPSANLASSGGVLWSTAGGQLTWRGGASAISTIAASGSSGSVSSQSQSIDKQFGTVQTVSSSTPTAFLNYNTSSVLGTGGIITAKLVSRATTTGTGITLHATAASTYTITWSNLSGTVSISAVTLVGSSLVAPTGSAITSALTATTSGGSIIFRVTNTNLCTVDTQLYLENVIN